MTPSPHTQLFESSDGTITLELPLQGDTVWLSEQQFSLLFEKERRTIHRHIQNIFKEKELDKNQVVAKFAHPSRNSKNLQRTHYNLDVLLSLGYRLNSPKGVLFRKWANALLKQSLLEGETLHKSQPSKGGVENMQNAQKLSRQAFKITPPVRTQPTSTIDIIQRYSKTWETLLRYDERRLNIPENDNKGHSPLSIRKIRSSIAAFKKELFKINQATDLFGTETAPQLDAIIACLDQTFDGRVLYKSIEEKAANLLYLIVKDHPFVDGNKRIGSFLFISYLISSSKKPLSPRCLVAMTLLIAQSNPKQKDIMIKLIINLLLKF